MSDHPSKLNLPNNAVSNAAGLIMDNLPDDCVTTPPGEDFPQLIAQDWIEPLAEHLQHVVACVIATLINAGSERDAVMENEKLREALEEEIKGWSDHPDNEPTGA